MIQWFRQAWPILRGHEPIPIRSIRGALSFVGSLVIAMAVMLPILTLFGVAGWTEATFIGFWIVGVLICIGIALLCLFIVLRRSVRCAKNNQRTVFGTHWR